MGFFDVWMDVWMKYHIRLRNCRQQNEIEYEDLKIFHQPFRFRFVLLGIGICLNISLYSGVDHSDDVTYVAPNRMNFVEGI